MSRPDIRPLQDEFRASIEWLDVAHACAREAALEAVDAEYRQLRRARFEEYVAERDALIAASRT